MSMVSPVERAQAPLLAQPYYTNGDPGPIATALAHVPEMLEVALPFVGMVLGASSIDARTKELVIVRTSAVMGCRYCTETHAAGALDAGLQVEEVRSLCDVSRPVCEFDDPGETALLAWVEAVALGPSDVPVEVACEFARRFVEPDIVELTLLVAATLMLNRFCTVLGLPTGEASLARLAEAGLSLSVARAAPSAVEPR